MEEQEAVVAPPSREVLMVEPEVVRQVRQLAEKGWGAKRIAAEVGIARNTVRRYLRGAEAGVQVRPAARRLDDAQREEARRLFVSAAEGNAVVVRDLLAEAGIVAGIRTVQRAVAGRRRELRASDLASIRFETAPGQQMQIDFGQKRVRIAGEVVHLRAAVLSYSRRIFVRAFLAERQDDWREGIAEAFRHFGGVPRDVLGDNAKALVLSRDREANTVTFHPAYLAFCRDWDVVPRACAPYRARSKGKVESGVKYVKRNALAGLEFASFAELELYLAGWMVRVDQREHGTTREPPAIRFERAERAALRPLPARPLPAREQRLRRIVANDSFVDVDTVRYSVPHQLVREHVEVHQGEADVRVFHSGKLVAAHRRSREPYAKVVDPQHFAGLHAAIPREPAPGALAALGRSLSEYAAALERGAA